MSESFQTESANLKVRDTSGPGQIAGPRPGDPAQTQYCRPAAGPDRRAHRAGGPGRAGSCGPSRGVSDGAGGAKGVVEVDLRGAR